jgi:hypothetical protein
MDRPTTGQLTDQPPADPLWLPIAEAAVRLGITENAVRNRLKRRTLRSRKGNDRRVFVLLDPTDQPPTNDRPATDQPSDQPPATQSDQSADLRAEVARLTGRLEGATARLADRDGQIAQLRADHRAELDRLAAAHAAELARLQHIIDRLAAPWWRRWFRG